VQVNWFVGLHLLIQLFPSFVDFMYFNCVNFDLRFIVMVAAKSVTGITYEITSGNIGNKFSLNFHSGVVSLASCLDRETVASYNLTVTATTAEGQTADASVVITVLDYNDNR